MSDIKKNVNVRSQRGSLNVYVSKPIYRWKTRSSGVKIEIKI